MVRIKVRWRCVNNSVCSCHSCLPAYANIGWCGLVATWRIYVYYTYVSYLVGKNQLLQGTSSVGDGYVFFRVPARSLEAKPLSLSFPCSLSLCLSVSVSLSLSLSVSFCLCLSPPPPPTLSITSMHRRRDREPTWDSEKLYLTSPPCPSFNYPLSWPFPSPSLSGHRRSHSRGGSKVADSRIDLDLLALSVFSLLHIYWWDTWVK